MKKLIITSSAVLMSLSLVGCNTMNSGSNLVGNTVQYGAHTVGTGIKYGAQTVGTGIGYVANTGAFVGRGVGTVVGGGLGLVTGQNTSYQKNGMIYHNGHQYRLQNGKYVLIR